MGNILKKLGTGCVLLSCLGLLGAMFGAAVERDTSMFLPVFIFSLFGVSLFAIGSKLEGKRSPSSDKVAVASQILSGILLIIQVILVLVGFSTTFSMLIATVQLKLTLKHLAAGVAPVVLFLIANKARKYLLRKTLVEDKLLLK